MKTIAFKISKPSTPDEWVRSTAAPEETPPAEPKTEPKAELLEPMRFSMPRAS